MIKKVVCLIVELSLLTALSACSSSEVKETKDSQDRNDKYSSSGQSSTASADVESVGESEKSIPEVKRDEKIAMSQYAL